MGWQSCTDKGSFTRAILDALVEEYHFSLDTPFRDYPKEIHDVLIHGTGGKVLKVRYKGPERRGRLRCGLRGTDSEYEPQVSGDFF